MILVRTAWLSQELCAESDAVKLELDQVLEASSAGTGLALGFACRLEVFEFVALVDAVAAQIEGPDVREADGELLETTKNSEVVVRKRKSMDLLLWLGSD